MTPKLRFINRLKNNITRAIWFHEHSRLAAFFTPKSRGKHELQRKGLVLDVGFMRPRLVWRGYWIDGGYVMSEWIKCEDFLPEPDSKVIAYTSHGQMIFDMHYKWKRYEHDGWMSEHCLWSGRITHWMPFPEPPAD